MDVTILDPFIHDVRTPRVLFGAGQLSKVAIEVDRLGAQRVLLISTRSAGVAVDQVTAQLGHKQVDRINEVSMHVPAEVVASARGRATSHNVDLLLCVGGGSAVGLAKALALAIAVPILAVPTTYAGSEMTDIWGRSDDGTKVTGRDPSVLPQVVVYDPLLTLDFPVELSVASGMNALAHSIEALYSPTADPVTTMYANESIGALVSALPRVVVDPRHLPTRETLLYGAWLAGWSLNATAMGLHHRLCHVLGGMGLPHSAVHSVLLPYVVAWISAAAPEVTASLASRHFPGSSPAVGLWELGRDLGVPTSLADVGYSADREDDVVHQVLTLPPESRRPVTQEAVREILSEADAGSRPQTPV